jgi:hypothetical protein
MGDVRRVVVQVEAVITPAGTKYYVDRRTLLFDTTGTVPLSQLEAGNTGDIMYYDGASWAGLSHSGSTGDALITTGANTFEWDNTPTWTGLHTFNAGLTVAAGQNLNVNGNLRLIDTGTDHYLTVAYNEDATADRALNVTLNDGDRTLALSGNLTVESASVVNQDLTTDAGVTFATVNTGQGANELYAMNQDVETIDSPTFANVYVPTGGTIGISGGELITFSSAAPGTITASDNFIIDDGKYLRIDATDGSANMQMNSISVAANGLHTLTLSPSTAGKGAGVFVTPSSGSGLFAQLAIQGDSSQSNYSRIALIANPSTSENQILSSRRGTGTLQPLTMGIWDIATAPGTYYVPLQVATDFCVDIVSFVTNVTTLEVKAVAAQTANLTDWLGTGGGGVAAVTVAGRIGAGTTSPAAMLHADQSSTTGAIPALWLQQRDISEEALTIEGESSAATADQTLVDARDFTTPGSIHSWVKVVIDDNRVGGLGTIDGWIPIYAIPTT